MELWLTVRVEMLWQKRNGYGLARRRMNVRTSMAQREEVIRRTVYVSDIDHQVLKEGTCSLFIGLCHLHLFTVGTYCSYFV